MSFLDVVTDVVAGAGQRTAATSTEWWTWAAQAAQWLADGPVAARDGTVGAAGAGYLEEWNPTLQYVGLAVSALGANTTAGSNAVSGADADASLLLAVVNLTTSWQTTSLDRQIETGP